jgi:hypothetical protein
MTDTRQISPVSRRAVIQGQERQSTNMSVKIRWLTSSPEQRRLSDTLSLYVGY